MAGAVIQFCAILGRLELGECNRQIPLHVSRAPEVTFEMSWGPPVDIWNLATLAMFRFAVK